MTRLGFVWLDIPAKMDRAPPESQGQEQGLPSWQGRSTLEPMSKTKTAAPKASPQRFPLCNVRPMVGRSNHTFAGMDIRREFLIQSLSTKWLNGTRLPWYLMGPGWTNKEATILHKAFELWQSHCGLTFARTDNPLEAIIRIAKDPNDGSWSYVGTDCKTQAQAHNPTMNLGWDINTPYGWVTVLHEIGHAIGMKHEHQNPLSGIKYNEPAVIAELSGDPNNWNLATIRRNVLTPLDRTDVNGSKWDHQSVMHYAIPGSWILEHAALRTNGIPSPAGLSETDVETIGKLYPKEKAVEKLAQGLKAPGILRYDIPAGEQVNIPVTVEREGRYNVETKGNLTRSSPWWTTRVNS